MLKISSSCSEHQIHSALSFSELKYIVLVLIPEAMLLFIYLFIYLTSIFLQHMEVPRLEVKLELQLPVYTTATATPDLSPVCQPMLKLTATPDP